MKKKLLIITVLILFCEKMNAQKASEILEKGIPVKSDCALFLKYNKEGKILNYAIAKSKADVQNPIKPIPLNDSIILLASQSAIPIYLLPLNPLSYAQSTENKIIVDPINEAALVALTSITDVLQEMMGDSDPIEEKGMPYVATYRRKLIRKDGNKNNSLCTKITTNLEAIKKKLESNHKAEIASLFTRLKALSFAEQGETKDSLDSIKKDIKNIQKHYEEIDETMAKTKDILKMYKPIACELSYALEYIFNDVLKNLTEVNDEQQKRVNNLLKVYELVAKAEQEASRGGGVDGLRWCMPLQSIPSTEGKISFYTISIAQGGYQLNDKNEITNSESKNILSNTLIVRKFQRFVPEVSVGTAFTFFKYNTYETTSDSTGQQYVASPTENTMRNLKIATMINFNYYMPNTALHPFYQIGLGINSEMPTLLTGFGFRSNINGVRRLAISGGVAMTWVKELDKLNVGSKVLGTDDIAKDLKFQFSWPPKSYISIQYNF